MNLYLTKIVVVFAYQLSINSFDQFTYSVNLLCFAYKPIPYEDSKLICLSTTDKVDEEQEECKIRKKLLT